MQLNTYYVNSANDWGLRSANYGWNAAYNKVAEDGKEAYKIGNSSVGVSPAFRIG